MLYSLLEQEWGSGEICYPDVSGETHEPRCTVYYILYGDYKVYKSLTVS